MKNIVLALLLLVSTAQAAFETGAANTVMRVPSSGSNGRPKLGSINLASSAAVGASILPEANGGTGLAALPDTHIDLNNLALSTTISSNTLVVAVKTKAAADASSGSPVKVGVRNATATTGTYALDSITAAMSVTLAATDSIGVPAAASRRLGIYYVSDTTSEVCLSLFEFDDRQVQSASALTGGADTSGTTLWCTSAHTSKPIRRIGSVTATWSNPNWTLSAVNLESNWLANALTSNGSAERVERSKIHCYASSSITSQSGSWLDSIGNRSGTACVVTITTGIFSSSPSCWVIREDTTVQAMSVVPASATSVTVYGPSADYDAYLFCMGPR